MLSRTEEGVVIAKNGDHLTILLRTKNKVKVRVKYTTLKLGSKCHVCFDNSNGEITKVMDYDEPTLDIKAVPTPVEDLPCPAESDCIAFVEHEECSRRQEIEDWETEEELEFWSGVFSETRNLSEEEKTSS